MAVIDAPAALKRAQVALTASDTVSESRSPYSGVEDRLDFGGEWWALTLTTPITTWDDAAEVEAWADRLRDDDAIARLDLVALAPRRGTTAATVLTASATTAAGSRTLGVAGLGSGLTLGAGSFVSIGDRLHRVREAVTANGSGAATLSLFPRLRSSVASGGGIQIATGVRGLWRLQNRPGHAWDAQQWPASVLAAKTLQFVEAVA